MAEGHTHTPSRVAVKIEGSSGGFSLYNLAKLPSIKTYEDLLLHHCDGQGDAVDEQTTVTKIAVKVGVPESRRKWYKNWLNKCQMINVANLNQCQSDLDV